MIKSKTGPEIQNTGSTPASKPKLSTPRKIMLTLGSVFLVLAVGGFLAFRFFMHSVNSNLERSEIFIRTLASKQEQRLTHTGFNVMPRISPDGKALVYCHLSGFTQKNPPALILLDLASNQTRALGNGKLGRNKLSWTADGKSILTLSSQGDESDFWRIDPATGEQQQITFDHAQKEYGEISPDGRWLAFVQKDRLGREEVFLMPAAGGAKKQLTRTQSPFDVPHGLAWMAGSQQLAYLTPLHIFVLKLDGTVQKTVNLLPLQNPGSLLAHPQDPNRLFFKARANPNSLGWKLFACDLSAQTFTSLLDAQLVSHYDMSWDGKLLVFEKAVPRQP